MILIMIKMLILLNSKLSCGLLPFGRVPRSLIRNSIFPKKHGQAGFTLIEVVIIIVIVSVFMAAIGIPLLNSLRESDLPEISTIAYFLGLEKLEELAPQSTGSISAEAKAAVSGYGDYEREVAVCDVDCDTLQTTDCNPASNPEQGSGCRKVTVTVYHSKIPNGVSLVSLRTAY
jgi:prepilin-type N-terminal cleavage/methylation domain-containing protein